MSDTDRTPPGEDEMITLRRDDYEQLLDRLEDAEDRAAVLAHRLEVKQGRGNLWLTSDEVNRLLDGASPVTIWREKRHLTQQALAGMAGISKSFLSEIENGTGVASVETLRKLAHELKVDLDTLVP
jgi:DNA-binding XRE family transcriptional regulator